MKIRVATWNLQRCSPLAWRKAPAQRRRIEQVDVDVWVLTETFTSRSPGPGFTGVFSPPHLERRPNPDERWTAVWSRWPIEPLDGSGRGLELAAVPHVIDTSNVLSGETESS